MNFWEELKKFFGANIEPDDVWGDGNTKVTDTLFTDLDDYLNANLNRNCAKSDEVPAFDTSFMEMVYSFAEEKKMSDLEVRTRAGLDKKAISKLRASEPKRPGKDIVFALSLALTLNAGETVRLLKCAGYELLKCSKKDMIIRYFIDKSVYDIKIINMAMEEHGEKALDCTSFEE